MLALNKTFAGQKLDRGPVRTSGEEAVDKADVVTDKNPETETDETRTENEAAVEPCETATRKRKRQGQSNGDQHHADDGAEAKDEQIEERPLGLAERA